MNSSISVAVILHQTGFITSTILFAYASSYYGSKHKTAFIFLIFFSVAYFPYHFLEISIIRPNESYNNFVYWISQIYYSLKYISPLYFYIECITNSFRMATATQLCNIFKKYPESMMCFNKPEQTWLPESLYFPELCCESKNYNKKIKNQISLIQVFY